MLEGKNERRKKIRMVEWREERKDKIIQLKEQKW
jgi:hypothetical protein